MFAISAVLVHIMTITSGKILIYMTSDLLCKHFFNINTERYFKSQEIYQLLQNFEDKQTSFRKMNSCCNKLCNEIASKIVRTELNPIQ